MNAIDIIQSVALAVLFAFVFGFRRFNANVQAWSMQADQRLAKLEAASTPQVPRKSRRAKR